MPLADTLTPEPPTPDAALLTFLHSVITMWRGSDAGAADFGVPTPCDIIDLGAMSRCVDGVLL